MTNRNYPTRMHEVLGVEPGERFRLKNDPHGNEWFVSENGMMIMDCEDGVARSGVHNVFSAINNGIIRKPRLSEEQVAQLRAIWTLGYRWLVKSKHCQVQAFEERPNKFELNYYWLSESGIVYYCLTKPSYCLESLVSWSDPEPLDIVATLKAAGVEVE